jgi:hypothetical protein
MRNRLPKKVEFGFTVVQMAYDNGKQVWNAYAKSDYWHRNEGIYRGLFELSPHGRYFKSYKDAIDAAIRYEDTMDNLRSIHAR